MRAHALFKLLNELGKRDKMRGLPRFLFFFCPMNLINSSTTQEQNVRFYSSYDIKS